MKAMILGVGCKFNGPLLSPPSSPEMCPFPSHSGGGYWQPTPMSPTFRQRDVTSAEDNVTRSERWTRPSDPRHAETISLPTDQYLPRLSHGQSIIENVDHSAALNTQSYATQSLSDQGVKATSSVLPLSTLHGSETGAAVAGSLSQAKETSNPRGDDDDDLDSSDSGDDESGGGERVTKTAAERRADRRKMKRFR